jgi:DNA-binding response OmpR family regulator
MSPVAKVPRDHRSTVCILVADADDDTWSLYRESLWLAGCDVVDAADGRDALVKALVHPPTVVIIETRLPIFDGHALCEVLRRVSTTRTVLILVVTTETRPAELDRARVAGADAVLVKPLSPDALLNELQRLLTRSRDLHSESTTHRATAAEGSGRLLAQSAVTERKALAKAHRRFQTTTPLARPRELLCRSCDRPLTYEHSHTGGVSDHHPEQWDYYVCSASCGTFQYRQRTRKLSRVADLVSERRP